MMKMMRCAIVGMWTLFLAAAGTGCEGELNDPEIEIDDLEQKADGLSYPVGTFGSLENPNTFGEPGLLVLKTDKTFHLEELPACPQGDDCHTGVRQVDGTYNFSRSKTKRYIRLFDGDGDLVHRFSYRFDGAILSLNEAPDTHWYDLPAANEPFCGEPTDCSLQGLSPLDCAGDWSCDANVCSFNCSITECTLGDDSTCPDGETCVPGKCKAMCLPDQEGCCAPPSCRPSNP